MTRVASPPRHPSILAIRSRWPVHVPTRDTVSSALNTGVETRMANAAEYKSAFMWGLHASIFEESHSRCEEGVTSVPVRRGVPGCGRSRRRPDGAHPTPNRPRIAGAGRSRRLDHLSWVVGLDFQGGGSRYGCLVSSVQDTICVVCDRCM